MRPWIRDKPPLPKEVRQARSKAVMDRHFAAIAPPARLDDLAATPGFVEWLAESFRAAQAEGDAQRKAKAVV